MLNSNDFQLEVNSSLKLVLPAKEWADSVFFTVDQNRMHLRRWLPWLDNVRTSADSEIHLMQNLESFKKGLGFSLAIVFEEEFVGYIGIHGFDALNRVTSFGYWLSERFMGKGIMTQSVMRLLDFVFEERNMNRVYVRCATGNYSSQAIPERLGFTHEGTQREAEWLYDHYVDLEVYSLLKREHQKLRLKIK